MSLNGFNGQQASRLPVRPVAEPQNPQAQAQWPQQTQAAPQAQQQAQWGQQPQQGFGGAPQSQGYAPQQVAPASGYGGLSANPDPYAPSFEPYTAAPAAPQRAAQPVYQPQAPQQAYQPQAAQPYAQHGYGAPDPRVQPQQQWSPQPANARGFEAGNYLAHPAAASAQANYRSADPRQHDSEPAISDWTNSQHANGQHPNGQTQGGHTQGGMGYEFGDAHGGHNDMGFAQAAGGELEQGYAEEDGQEYEAEETGRGRRPMMIAAALVGAIVIGAGFSYGYKAFLGGGATGTPPMVKSAVEPSKTKPADAGGKQFAHTDSKIMGRLGDGAAPAAAGEADPNGTRKVSTLVVGRDGSIQAPVTAPVEEAANAAPAATSPITDAGVPGMMVVDALGTNKVKTAAAAVAGGANAAQAAAQQVAAVAPPSQKVVVTPPPAAAKVLPEATGSIEPQAAAPAPAPKKIKKVAAAAPAAVNDAAPAAAPSVASGATNGFVAVLASVPKSASSNMDALKRFADLQQKYGNVLGGKTPVVADANLGTKGQYHRLVVGPPGSREQASGLCAQMKALGYADCWVTAY